jgi:3-methyladenine DNA glycosylase AlkD
MLNNLKKDLQKLANPIKAKNYARFFKTGKGEYGEGDKFLGVVVPQQRKVAVKYKDLELNDLQKLLSSNIHEYRLTALFILVSKYRKNKKEKIKNEDIVKFYLKNTKNINNWDLVDSSAHYILGDYLLSTVCHSRESGNPQSRFANLDSRFRGNDIYVLYKLAESKNLWERRIAIISTFAFIRGQNTPSPVRGGIKGGVSISGDCDANTPSSVLPLNVGGNHECFVPTLKISEILLNDKHDLIHKAVGWMLREVGKRDQKVEEEFLAKYYKQMPRTMLRYAIEKFTKGKREKYLQGTV